MIPDALIYYFGPTSIIRISHKKRKKKGGKRKKKKEKGEPAGLSNR